MCELDGGVSEEDSEVSTLETGHRVLHPGQPLT